MEFQRQLKPWVGERLRFPMSGYANALAAAYGCRDASEQSTHDHCEGNPENQLRDESSLDVSRPEACLWESRRQSVVVRTPIPSDGEKRQDDHRNSRRIPIRQQHL